MRGLTLQIHTYKFLTGDNSTLGADLFPFV